MLLPSCGIICYLVLVLLSSLIAPLQSSHQDDRNGVLVHPIRSPDAEIMPHGRL
jgi:hypothetical protein